MCGWQVMERRCCGLETGSNIIAALDLLISLTSVIVGSINMASVSTINHMNQTVPDHVDIRFLTNFICFTRICVRGPEPLQKYLITEDLA